MINLKSEEDIRQLRIAGQTLAGIINELKSSLKAGMSTKDIDVLAEQLINKNKAKPAFKGYRGFPACACVSLNEEVVHGIPGKRKLKDGDLVSVDIGIILNDFYSDTAFTVGVGNLEPQLADLIDVTQRALMRGIEQARANNHLTDISFAIQSYIESKGYSVVRDFVGHGIGRSLHEDPEVPNFGLPHSGPVLKEGMVLAIEPMVNVGTWETEILDDGWTVVTKDRKPSAHFEHTVAVTAAGPEILTRK